jgi:sorbitol/mannitol transport system substrate-binding protein
MYEVPIWGSCGSLEAFEFGGDYDADDILAAMRGGLSHKGTLYAAPF